MIRTESQRQQLMVRFYGKAAGEIPGEAGDLALKKLIRPVSEEYYAHAFFRKSPMIFNWFDDESFCSDSDKLAIILEHGILSETKSRELGLPLSNNRNDLMNKDFIGLMGGDNPVRDSLNLVTSAIEVSRRRIVNHDNSLLSVIVDGQIEVSMRVNRPNSKVTVFVLQQVPINHIRAISLGYGWDYKGIGEILKIMSDLYGQDSNRYLPILDSGNLLWPDSVRVDEMSNYMREVVHEI